MTEYHYKYLDSKNYRYKETAKRVNFSGKHVVDLCSGNTGLYEYVKDKVASYRACDLFKLQPIVEQVDDWEFAQSVTVCDVLVCYGVGGYEISKEQIESKTVTNSIRYLMEKFSPAVVVIESIKTYQSILEGIADNDRYTKDYYKTDSSNWLDDRVIIFMEKKNASSKQSAK